MVVVMAGGRSAWVTTTHDWSSSLDSDHIRFVRRHADRYARGGPLHLLLEVVAYADDEAREQNRTGRCNIILFADGSIRVEDDGRGTDTRIDLDGAPVRKPIMSTKDVRFFAAEPPVLLRDGLPRRDASVVSALSDWLHHLNRRSDRAWEQRYELGRPTGPLAEVAAPAVGTGTTVTFHLDPTLVPATRLTADIVQDAARFPSLVVRCVVEASQPRV
jgi:DNA gyrase subunit B